MKIIIYIIIYITLINIMGYNQPVRIIYPNGGEKFYTGDNVTIRWTDGGLLLVRVHYSTNNGGTWVQIYEGTNNRSYNWTIPSNISSTQCRVKVEDWVNSSQYDISDDNFTIQKRNLDANPKSLTFSHSGGQQTVTVTSNMNWSVSENLDWITVSPQSGSNNGSFTVNCQQNTSTNSRSGIITISGTGVSPITINVSQSGSAPVTVLYPNGGEKFYTGDNVTIRWTDGGLLLVRVHYSTNNGGTWVQIYEGTNNRSYNWTIPSNISSTQCRVKVEDWVNSSQYDISDDNFTIQKRNLDANPKSLTFSHSGGQQTVTVTSNMNWSVSENLDWITVSPQSGSNNGSFTVNCQQNTSTNSRSGIITISGTGVSPITINVSQSGSAPVTVLYPNGGEKFYTGDNVTIRWTDGGLLLVRVHYSTNNGGTWVQIYEGTNNRSYNWTIPSNISSTQCRVKVEDWVNSSQYDISDDNFTIQKRNLDANPKSLTFSHSGGQQTVTVTSNMNWSVSENLDWITVSPQSGSNNGSFTVNCQQNTSTNSRSGIITISGTGVSPITINVSQSGSAPVTVLYPNGGEKFYTGDNVTIRWTDGGLLLVRVHYSTDNGGTWVQIYEGTNNRSYNWTIPSNISSTQCRVKVEDWVNSSQYDISDDNFTIQKRNLDANPKSLTFSHSGGQQTVTVTSNMNWSVSENLDWITVSPQSGSNNGSFTVNCQQNTSTNSRSGIITISGTGVSPITINVSQSGSAPVTVLYPNGGEKFYTGDNVTIRWTDGGLLLVRVHYSTNNGGTWVQIYEGTNNRSYNWTIPSNISSTQCRVKVEDWVNSSQYDISDDNFTIQKRNLDANPKSLTFSHSGGQQTVTVTSNMNWSVSENLDWITVSPQSGSNNGSFTVNCQQNTSTNSRSGIITVSGGGVSVTINVFQDGTSTISGSLRVYVKKQDGSSVSGAIVRRYSSNWDFIDTSHTDLNGIAFWSNIPSGNYFLEVYYNGNRLPFNKEEYWISKQISVKPGGITELELRRNEPYCFDIKLKNSSNGIELSPSNPIPPGTSIKAEITINNLSLVDRKVKVRMVFDRSTLVSSNFNCDKFSTESVVSGNGGTKVFTINVCSPTEEGLYYRGCEVLSYINSKYVITDTWAWGPSIGAFNVYQEGKADSLKVNVLYPRGGETFVPGSSINIQWNWTGSTVYNTEIVLYKGDLGKTIFTGIISNKGFNTKQWIIPNDIQIGTDYKIKIKIGEVSSDFSDGYFTIQTLSGIITFINPTGGELWSPGSLINLRWIWTGNNENNVPLYYYKDNTSTLIAKVNLKNGENTYDWLIPSNIVTGSDFRIFIKNSFSNYFSIQKLPPLDLSITPTTKQILSVGDKYTFNFYVSSNGIPVEGARIDFKDPISGITTFVSTDFSGKAKYEKIISNNVSISTYIFNFIASKNGYSNSSSLSREVTITQGNPVLYVNPKSVNINYLTTAQIVISNKGGGVLEWFVSTLPGWIRLNQVNGRLLSNQEQIIIISNVNFTPINPQASFIISSNGGNQSVTVNYIGDRNNSLYIYSVEPKQLQEVGYNQSIDYSIKVVDGNNNPVSGAKVIVNDEILGIQTETDTTNSQGIVNYSTAYISPNVPNGSIFNVYFRAKKDGYQISELVERKIKVNQLMNNPIIHLSENNKIFTASIGGPLPEKQTINLKIIGSKGNTWQITNKPNWLNINPAYGTEPDVVIDIQPNTTNLNPMNSPYEAQLMIQCLNAINSPKFLNVKYFISDTKINSLKFGTIQINAFSFTSIGSTIVRASGNVNINNIIWFSGYIDVDTNTFNPKISGNCEIFIPINGIPMLSKVTLYEGDFSVEIWGSDGILKRFINNNSDVRKFLKIAGLNVKIDDIYLVEDGVKIEGDIQFNNIFGLNLHLKDILIKKNDWPKISFLININDIQLLSGLRLDKLKLSYDSQNDVFIGDAYLKTPAFQVGCKFGISQGSLDSIELRSGGLNIPIGTTGLSMKSLIGGIYNLKNPPMEIRLKANVSTIDPLISQIVQLQDLGLSYLLPSTITGSGNLTLFNKYNLSEAYFTLSYPSYLKFGGNINIDNLFNGKALLNLSFAPNWEISGTLSGSLLIRDGEGFPYDLLKSPPFSFSFPIIIGNTSNHFRNFLTWGSLIFNVWPINLEIAYSIDFEPVLKGNPPNFIFGYNGYNANNEIFVGDISVNKIISNQNRFEGMSLNISASSPNKYLEVEGNLLSQTIPIKKDYDKIIIRVGGLNSFPVTSIKNPDGLVFNPSDTINLNKNKIKFISDFMNKKVFWIIDNPKIGNWLLSINNNGSYVLDVITFVPVPLFEFLEFETDNTTDEIKWFSSFSDTSTKISLYYDNDAKNFDGGLIAKDISVKSGINVYYWPWEKQNLMPGAYYIYGVIERNGEKFYKYSNGRIIIKPRLKSPTNLIATEKDGKIKLEWVSTSELKDGYIIKYWDIGDERRVNYLTVRDTNQIELETVIPGRDYKFSIEAFNSLNQLSSPTFSNILNYVSLTSNNFPVIRFNEYDSLLVTQWSYYQLNLPAIDKDGDNLLYTLIEGPDGMSINNNGIVKWFPASVKSKTQDIKVRVTDGLGGYDTISLSLNFNNNMPIMISLDRSNYENLDVIFITVKDPSANISNEKKDIVKVSLELINDTIYVYYTDLNNKLFSDIAFIKNKYYQNFSTFIDCIEIDVNSGIFLGVFKNLDKFQSINLSSSIKLYQNYPNPFKNATLIRYYIPEPNNVSIDVYNILGQRVATLENNFKMTGEYLISWDGKNMSGHKVSAGIYFVVLKCGKNIESKKILLIK